jgi:two-component system chemotaxis response regulator CheB
MQDIDAGVDPATTEYPTAVVLLAASAGGVHALSSVLKGLPRSLSAAVVVVLHRSPFVPSALHLILQRYTNLSVSQAMEGETVRAGHVYIARPDLHLRFVSPGAFSYADGHRIRHVLSSANPLFESAAAVFGRRAIGVVLTGGGFDATDGVQAVHSGGGIVIVQDPGGALVPSMPTAALKTGAADFVLRLSDIGPMIGRLVDALERSPRAEPSAV